MLEDILTLLVITTYALCLETKYDGVHRIFSIVTPVNSCGLGGSAATTALSIQI
ncbi:hypothetical protein J6590_056813 [Homalodisca vitripennis]|nr:hypothetical protein J6590_056813 [Homalodisca vitripennis]